MIESRYDKHSGEIHVRLDYNNVDQSKANQIHRIAMKKEKKKKSKGSGGGGGGKNPSWKDNKSRSYYVKQGYEEYSADSFNNSDSFDSNQDFDMIDDHVYELEQQKLKNEILTKENDKLKKDLDEAKKKLQFVKTEIYHENLPLGFDYESIGLKVVAPTLHDEVVMFEKNITRFIYETTDLCNSIVKRVKGLVRQVSPNLRIDLYGSFATGLCMPWSDIDFVLSSEDKSQLSLETVLKDVSKAFKEDTDFFSEVKYIPGAVVPILKATCTKEFNFMKIDLTVQDLRHNGLSCVELVQAYLTKFSCLRYLVLPLKQLLFNSELNDPYQGGMTSYGLILMIVSFLQFKLKNNESISIERPNLGQLFIEFLNFYMNFDYTGMEIIPLKPGQGLERHPFDKYDSSQYNDYGATCMHIRDPLNPTNNVSRSCHKFVFMRNIFYFSFFSAFPLGGSELRDRRHQEIRDKTSLDLMGGLLIQPRKHVLLKVFNASKAFTLLNKNTSALRV